MSHRKPPSKLPTHRVNWSDPHLESLLRKTLSWQIDNRGSYPSLAVEIYLGWDAATCKPALLVWERDNVIVLETRFPLPQNEHLRVDKPFGDGIQTRWGKVVESRAGHRAGDEENGIQVHWVHLR